MVMDDHDEEEEDDEADYVAECGVMTVMIGKSFPFCVSKRTAQQLIQSANLVMMSISLKASAFRARGQDQQKLTFRTRSGLVVMGEKEI